MKSRKVASTQKRSPSTSEGKIQGQSNLLKKTKAQLIEELEQMRLRLSELGSADEVLKKTDKALTKSVTHLHAILDAATEVSLITSDLRGKDSRILEFSTGAENIFDYQRDEVIGKSVTMLHLPEEAARLSTMFEAMRKHREGFTGEWTLVRKSGEEFPALFTTHPILDSDGNTVAALSIAIDISERKQAEEALRESEERYRALVENAFAGLVILDTDGNITYESPANERLLGYEAETVDGASILSAIHPEDHPKLAENFARVLNEPDIVVPATYRVLHRDGSWHVIETLGRNFIENPHIQGIVVNFRDITERKQAEERVEHLNLVLRSIRDVNQLIITEKDPERLIQSACNRLTHTRGYFGAWIVLLNRTGTPVANAQSGFGNDFATIAKQLKRGKLPQCAKLALAQSDILEIKDRARVCRGCPLWRKDEDIESMCIRLEHDQNIYGVICVNLPTYMAIDAEEQALFSEVASDIALALHGIEEENQRKLAEESGREGEERYRTLLENAGTPIAYYTLDGTALLINTIGAKNLGITPEEFVGKSIYDSLPDLADITMKRMKQIEKSGTGAQFEDLVQLPSGDRWFLSDFQPVKDKHGKIFAVQIISQDTTHQKQAEEALQESEEKYRTIFESASDAIFTLRMTVEGPRFADCNSNALKLYGCKPEEIIGASPLNFSSHEQPDGRSSAEKIDGIAVATMAGELLCFEWRHRRLDGTLFDTEVTVTRIDIGGESYLQAIVRDVTERKQAEEALRESEEKFRMISNQSLMGVIILQDELFVFVNDRAAAIMEVPAEEIANWTPRNYANLIHPDDRDFVMDQGRKKQAGEKDAVFHYNWRMVTPGGNLKWIEMWSKSILFRGRIADMVTTIDITERKQVEDALQESEEKYRNVVERANDVIVIMQDGVLKYTNPLASTMMGYTPEEAIGRPLSDFVHPDEVQTAVDRYTRRMAGEDMPPIYETALLHKDGRRIEIELSGGVISYLGRPADLIIIRNVTERKEAEKEIRASEEKLRTIFEAANDAIIYVDEQGTIIDANSKLEHIFGYKREEVIGKNFAEFAFLEPAGMKQIVDLFTKSLAAEGPALIEIEVRHKDGHTVFAEASTTTIEDDTGVRGALTILRDITERKQTEAEAARARALEELDQLRTALLASVSHELRTPLTSIKGLASTLVQPDVEWDAETQMDFLKNIVQESDRLNHIVSDLLEMSRLEAGMMRIEKTETQISAIVKQVGDELRNITQKHRFEINIPPDMPRIYADEIRIGEVITNLVSNAASYSEEGTQIAIDASQSNGEIVVSVIDEGIGIPPEHQDKVFDRFYRLESGVSRRRGGSSLGLAICKGIIEEHGGQISVESNLGEGSKFSFSLAIAKRIETDHDSSIPNELRES